jgi:hypothetical protein
MLRLKFKVKGWPQMAQMAGEGNRDSVSVRINHMITPGEEDEDIQSERY